MSKKKPKPPSKTNMTVSIESDYYEYLKKLNYKLSAEENKKIGLSEVVRRALDAHWPIPQAQMTFFDLKKEKSNVRLQKP